jgi:hypothetical protein
LVFPVHGVLTPAFWRFVVDCPLTSGVVSALVMPGCSWLGNEFWFGPHPTNLDIPSRRRLSVRKILVLFAKKHWNRGFYNPPTRNVRRVLTLNCSVTPLTHQEKIRGHPRGDLLSIPPVFLFLLFSLRRVPKGFLRIFSQQQKIVWTWGIFFLETFFLSELPKSNNVREVYSSNDSFSDENTLKTAFAWKSAKQVRSFWKFHNIKSQWWETTLLERENPLHPADAGAAPP